MAKIDVQAIVTAPEKITIPLVRADYHSTSNVFRVAFEIFLALLCATIGHILSLKVIENIHYFLLTLCAISAISFLICSVFYARKSYSV